MDNERQQSNLGRWIMLYVMLGFFILSIFSLADAIKAPVVEGYNTASGGRSHVWMTDGSYWKYDFEAGETTQVTPPAR